MQIFLEKPQFSHTNQTLYAIASQTTQIKCEIESSVPPVINFKFTKNGRLLETSTHHRIDSYPEQNFANLTIVDVQDEDFGHYSCIAHNGILGNDMLVDLLAASKNEFLTTVFYFFKYFFLFCYLYFIVI